jgi:uncharacterized Zn finger protein (UPF0148 family)
MTRRADFELHFDCPGCGAGLAVQRPGPTLCPDCSLRFEVTEGTVDIEPAKTESDRVRRAFEALGLPVNSSYEDARRAHRRLARTCHPDLNGGEATCTRRMQVLNEALEILRQHREGLRD